MCLSKLKAYLFIGLVAIAGTACSNSKPASEGNVPEDMLANAEGGSQADAVGSIPEDSLMAPGEEPTSAAAPANEAEALVSSSKATDNPFSDLKENEKSDSLAVIEDGEKKEEGTGSMDTYTVKAGDTLMKVAFSIYGDIERWKDLQEWNQASLKKRKGLRKGMKLQYEVPATAFNPEQRAHAYEIKKGDTLAGIADEVYGRKMKYKKLQGYNRQLIRNPNRIFAGFTIYYDITQKEMAEAEARRQERMAGGGGDHSVPSSLVPPPTDLTAPPPPIAVAPPAPASTGESSAVPLPPPPPPAQ